MNTTADLLAAQGSRLLSLESVWVAQSSKIKDEISDRFRKELIEVGPEVLVFPMRLDDVSLDSDRLIPPEWGAAEVVSFAIHWVKHLRRNPGASDSIERIETLLQLGELAAEIYVYEFCKH